MFKRFTHDFFKSNRKAVIQLAIALGCIVYVAPDYWRAVTTFNAMTPFAVFLVAIFAFVHGRALLDNLTRRDHDERK